MKKKTEIRHLVRNLVDQQGEQGAQTETMIEREGAADRRSVTEIVQQVRQEIQIATDLDERGRGDGRGVSIGGVHLSRLTSGRIGGDEQ